MVTSQMARSAWNGSPRISVTTPTLVPLADATVYVVLTPSATPSPTVDTPSGRQTSICASSAPPTGTTIQDPSGAIAAGPNKPSAESTNTDGAEPSRGTRATDVAVLATTADPSAITSMAATGPSAASATSIACCVVRSQADNMPDVSPATASTRPSPDIAIRPGGSARSSPTRATPPASSYSEISTVVATAVC